MDQYTKILLTIITVCVVVVTLMVVGSAIIGRRPLNYFEYIEHVIERLESIEEHYNS